MPDVPPFVVTCATEEALKIFVRVKSGTLRRSRTNRYLSLKEQPMSAISAHWFSLYFDEKIYLFVN